MANNSNQNQTLRNGNNKVPTKSTIYKLGSQTPNVNLIKLYAHYPKTGGQDSIS